MKAQPTERETKKASVIQQTSRIQTPSPRGGGNAMKDPVFDDVHARITGRAYELYIERGRREGYAEQDWLDAEREIVGRTASA